MRYKVLPHTADVRLRVYGKDLEDLFQNAVLGLAFILTEDAERLAKRVRGFRKIKTYAPDEGVLLVNFLNDVLTFSHTDKKVYPRAKILRISSNLLEAHIFGVSVSNFQKDVKAISYHEVGVSRKRGSLEATIILDI